MVTTGLKKERSAVEAEERRREEEAERRRQEESRRREEEKRVWSLIREAHRWQLSQIIHSYVDGAEDAGTVVTRL